VTSKRAPWAALLAVIVLACTAGFLADGSLAANNGRPRQGLPLVSPALGVHGVFATRARPVRMTYAWRGSQDGIRIIKVPAAGYRLEVVYNNGVRATTSATCRRIGCLAAINGDFFSSRGPVGAITSQCRVYKTADVPHEYALLGAKRLSRNLPWSTAIRLPDGSSVPVAAIGAAPADGGLELHTSVTDSHGVPAASGKHDYLFELMSGTAERLNQYADLEFIRTDRSRARFLSTRQVLLRTSLRAPLQLTPGQHVRINLSAPPGYCEVVGGHPIIIEQGLVTTPAASDVSMWRARSARSVLGWNAVGEAFLITVDAASGGATTPELARFLLEHLHLQEAINLDGGGSSTLVDAGQLWNRPATGTERPVAAVVVVTPS
jgi:hypothetical protein